MKVCVLGDFHIWNHSQLGGPMEEGLNRRCRDLIRDISDVVEAAVRDHGVEAVVQLGDFFDKSNPPPAVMNAAMGLLKRFDVQWHILAGNHDIRAFGAPSAVKPLGHLSNVKVYEEPTTVTIGRRLWAMVPFTARTARESVAWVRNRECHAAALHYGLVNRAQPDRPDTIPIGDALFQNVQRHSGLNNYWFFGHEHGSRAGFGTASLVWSLGSFSQHNFGDPLIQYVGVLLDDSFPYPIQIPGPRFTDLRSVDFSVCSLHGALLAAMSTQSTNIYCLFKPEDQKIAERLREVGLITDFRIAPLERSDDEGFSEPLPVRNLNSVDIDQCVLEELQMKRTDDELLKAWEYYEDLKRRS